jgi:hypothetical protein
MVAGETSNEGKTEMTEAFVTDPGSTSRKIPAAARRGAAVFAALAGFAMLAAPIHGAFGAQGATQVRNVDDPGRIAYQSTQSGKAGAGFQFTFPAVPAGHRLVIQHISSRNVFFKTTIQEHVFVLVSAGATVDDSITFFAPFSLALVAFDQAVQLYVDAGGSPSVTVVADNGKTLPNDFGSQLTLTGYLLDCTAAPCAPIAQ